MRGHYPKPKVHGANMGPIWGRQEPDGPHVGPMNLAIWVCRATSPSQTVKGCSSFLFVCLFFVSVLWLHAYLTDPSGLRGTAPIRSPDFLSRPYLYFGVKTQTIWIRSLPQWNILGVLYIFFWYKSCCCNTQFWRTHIKFQKLCERLTHRRFCEFSRRTFYLQLSGPIHWCSKNRDVNSVPVMKRWRARIWCHNVIQSE